MDSKTDTRTDSVELPDEMFLVSLSDDEGDEIRRTLSFTRSPTVLLTFAANRFTRAAAKVYQDRYGIGVMDWRMLVMLTREPGATVIRSSDVIGIDKAAVSRCLSRLEAMEYATPGELHANGRSRGWRLTKSGRMLHDRILRDALDRQRRLFDGFSPEEVKSLCNMLNRFLQNLEVLKSADRE